MRPRHHTAENHHRRILLRRFPKASMRPRHHTAENAAKRIAERSAGLGFNEAAASHRGKPYGAPPGSPRFMSFNEAAASHRGKRHLVESREVARPASMRPRHHTAENDPAVGLLEALVAASMRPRHHTAENAIRCERRWRRRPASMRPRHHTAENHAVAER